MADPAPRPTGRPVSRSRSAGRRLVGYFLRGMVFLTPVALTLYVVVLVLRTVDGWLGFPIPGAGFVVTVALVTLFGFLASGFITRSIVAALDDLMERLPFVRLLYSSIRDFVNAFVGEKRRFDKPVLVKLFDNSSAHALGFVTQESLGPLGLPDWVSVYMPHSYNFSGQMYVFPRAAITPLDASSSDMMAFVVSGGVTEIPTIQGNTPPESGR
ncbi:MAG: DUF502 domain-containing protein [Gemmatimonadetes bacterium]|nr:DUF502 domain-containing protein [Gemmatimonadota bacterium]